MADVEPPPPETSQTTPNTASAAAEGNRPWERPWTVEEMRKEANNWSLSGDAGLLLYLKDFSQKMISRVHEIEKEVDGLMHDSKMTGVRANNVFNDFIMLANTQFVENRVYDEDVSQEDSAKGEEGNEEKEKTREQREAELIPKVKEALELGINVIDQAFEQLDTHVADSDSEDEETAYRTDPLLEAKDPYIARSLPLLIGTPKFMEDDCVGLAEEESEEEESDHGSLSESESEKEEEEEDRQKGGMTESSDEYSDSEEESGSDKPVKTGRNIEESESEGSDLFGEENEEKSESENSASEEEAEEEPTVKEPSAPMDFASELAKKLNVPSAAPTQDSAEEDEERPPVKEVKETKRKDKKKRDKKESTSSSKTKNKKNEKIEEEPFPADDEEDSPFGNKGGLFSGSKGLFDDSEEDEGDLFSESAPSKKSSTKIIESDKEEEEAERPVERKRTASSKKPKGGVSIFGNDAGDDMFSEKKTEKKQQSSAPSSSSGGGGGGGLFDDEDEDDLFSSAAPKTTEEKPKRKETGRGGAGLFDEEEEEDLFAEGKKEEPEKDETTPPAKQANKKKLPPGAVPMFGGGPNPLAAAIKKHRKQDSDEDNDWSDEDKPRSASVKSSQSVTSINSLSKSTGVSKVSNKPSPSPSSNSLFDEDADDNALFSAPAKPRADSKSKAKPTKSLFEDEEEDLFTSKPANKPPAKKPQTSTALFDDEEDDGLFAKPKDSGKKKPAGGVSLFGEDILSKKDTPSQKKPEPTKTSKPAKTALSLFDDDDEEEEEGDIFGAPAPKKETAKPTSASKAKGLFDDGNDMFGEEDSPGVDIFNQPKGASKPNETPVSKTTAPKGGGGLFEEAEDDLFNSTKPSAAESVPVGGVTTEESTDVPDKVEEQKPKKPVGGVSMFGGMDPMAALKNRKKDKEVKDTPEEPDDISNKPEPPPMEAPKTEKKSKPVDPLFDDEEDDLFSSPPKQATVEEKEEVKPKKPVGGISMFGGMDPMAALGKKARKENEVKASDLTSSPTEVKDTEDDDRPQPPPLDSPKLGHKAKPVDPLFGDDDDDEDDMFKVLPVKNISTTHPSKPATSSKPIPPSKPKHSKSETSNKADLFGSPKSEDDDMFSSKPPAKETQSSPLGSSPRKPVGGVSMFGGVDLFGTAKKSEPEPGPLLSGGDTEKKTESTGSVGNKMPGKIGKLKTNLVINPAAMLPGAAPPVKEAVVVPVGFDVPAQANTLHSANKNRAKIQAKRRPPSRKGRQGGVPTTSVEEDSTSSTAASSPTKETPGIETRVPQPSSDLFGNDDLLGETDRVSDFMAPPPVPDNFEEESEDFFSSSKKGKDKIMSDDDLFSPVAPTADLSKSKSMMNSKSDEEDDLFGSSSVKNTSKSVSKRKADSSSGGAIVNGGEDVLSEPKSASKPVQNDDEDLFAEKPKTKKQSDFEKILDEKSEKSKPETKPAALNDEDDLFANSSLTKKPAKESKTVDEDDDIFADSSVNKKAASATKANDKKQEEDDLFGKSTQKTKKSSKARPKTKDEDLFKDDTDIFADAPSAKPKEKKKKKTTEKKSLFKDDDDDIFATATSKPKAKKEKKTEAPKKTTSDVSDIFDDPLN